MMRHIPVLDRWRDHRQTVEISLFGSRPPPVSHGEFLILAALEMVMATLDDVLAKVAEERTVEQSLSVLLDGYNDALKALTDQVAKLQKELAAAGQDTTKIDAIMASLDDNESVLNAARAKVIPAVMQPGPDTIAGAGALTDTVAGGNGTDTLVGGNTDDTVVGADTPTDTLIGGNGDDTISGGQGDVVAPEDLPNMTAIRDAITAAGGDQPPANASRADLEAALAALQTPADEPQP